MTRKKQNTIRLHWHAVMAWFGYGINSVRKKVVPKSLLYRFILIILLPLLLLQALILVFFFDRHWDTVSRRLASDISGEIAAVATVIQEEADEDIGSFLGRMNAHLGLSMTFIPAAQMPEVLPDVRDNTVRALVSALDRLPYPARIQETDNQAKIVWVQLTQGVLRAEIPRKRFFSSTVYVFWIWMIGFSILLFWIAFLFMKNQIRSIVRLSRAAEAFGRGQAVDTFRPEGATEVKQAGQSFLLMRDRISKYLTERTAMLSGVSHDLRTPLTRMKLQLSMMPADESVQDLAADVTDMEQMLEAYLAFARGEGKEQPENVHLNALLSNLVEKLTKSGQVIDCHFEQDIMLFCRPNDISRAVMNLLTNAGRYATKTQVTAGMYRHMARIIVDDDGPGIPAAKRELVFRAFTRLEGSRNRHTGGIGLGLTIARDIVLSHGGEIRLDKSPMGGLRAIILLPVTPLSE